jgi:hypothetical protein
MHRPYSARLFADRRTPQLLRTFLQCQSRSYANSTPYEVCPSVQFECPSDSHGTHSPRFYKPARYCSSLRQELKNPHVATGGTLTLWLLEANHVSNRYLDRLRHRESSNAKMVKTSVLNDALNAINNGKYPSSQSMSGFRIIF